METCYKAFRTEIIKKIKIEEKDLVWAWDYCKNFKIKLSNLWGRFLIMVELIEGKRLDGKMVLELFIAY